MIKKIFIILLAALPLLGFSIDYQTNDTYNPADYSVEAISISTAQDLFNAPGAHKEGIIKTIERELNAREAAIQLMTENEVFSVSTTAENNSDLFYYASYTKKQDVIQFNFTCEIKYLKTYIPEQTFDKWQNIVSLEIDLDYEENTAAGKYKLLNIPAQMEKVKTQLNGTGYNSYINYLNNYYGYVINIHDAAGENLYASAYIVRSEYASQQDAHNWDNLVVMADGLDYQNKRTIYQIIGKNDFNNLFSPTHLVENGVTQPTPLSSGYDICFVDFVDGAGDIRHNAKVYLKLLEYISDRSNKQFSAGGFSMGGVISRLALLYAEKQELFVVNDIKKFISIDSPQKGANINFQMQIDSYIHRESLTKESWDLLSQPAPLQMLYKHRMHSTTITGERASEEHDAFYSFLKDMGNFPKHLKKYSIACSPWFFPYENRQTNDAAQVPLNPLKTTLENLDTVPGSYTENSFSQYAIIHGTYYTGNPDDSYFKPTFIPVDSVYALIPGTTSDDGGNLADLKRLGESRFTPFDFLLATDNRDGHITFNPNLVGLIMKCLNDADDSTKEEKESLKIASSLLLM